MTKAKVLINDASNRFKAGEIGELIEHNFEKYDYCIDFGTIKEMKSDNTFIDKHFQNYRRVYYFYKDEVEIID